MDASEFKDQAAYIAFLENSRKESSSIYDAIVSLNGENKLMKEALVALATRECANKECASAIMCGPCMAKGTLAKLRYLL